MQHTRLLLFLGLLLVSGFALHSLRDSGKDNVPHFDPPYSLAKETGVEGSPGASELPSDRVPDGLPSLTAPVETRYANRIEVGTAPANVRWIAGRLQTPSGSPPDPSLAVVVLGDDHAPSAEAALTPTRSWEERIVLASAALEADGTFRLPIPATLTEVTVDIDGLYLYLPEPHRLEVAALGTDLLVLEPELGGAIRGTLQLPPGATDIPGTTHVGGFGMSFTGSGMTRATVVENTLEFELRALQPELGFRIWAASDIYPGMTLEDELVVSAGERLHTFIPLMHGACVRGRVVDGAGQPLQGVLLTGDSGVAYSKPADAGRCWTDENGNFELRGLAVRNQKLTAYLDGYLESDSKELELGEAQTQGDVEIVLDAGLGIVGTLQWPNGEPAADARITVIPIETSRGSWRLFERARSPEGSSRSAEDGSFGINALSPGTYAIYAERAGRGDANAAKPWNARVDTVEAGGSPLTLTLEAPLVLVGSVLDDAGVGVDSFTVTARRTDWPSWVEGPFREVEESFAKAGGAFHLDGLDKGTWDVHVRSDLHLRSQEQSVALGAGAGDVDPFVMTRAAALSGTVVDPAGAPVAGAEVRAIAQGPEGRHAVIKTAADGSFNIAAVGPGPVRLDASSDSWAPSLTEDFVFAPGDRLHAHVIHLTEGGTLRGQVLGEGGLPDSDRLIAVQSMEGDGYETFSDQAGNFLVEHLAPGSYQVIATPRADTWAANSEQQDLGDFFAEVHMASVTIVEQETTNVVLGAPPLAPVLVHGRVLSGGEPVPQAGILVVAESKGLLEGMGADTAGDDGSFSIQLDEPGDYTFMIMGGPSVDTEVDFQVTIPGVERHELDLRLPGGSIQGRLRTPQGEVPESSVLWVRREDGTSDLSAAMSQSAVSLEDDGSFVISTLHPGSYAISAVGDDSALTTLHGVVVVGDTVTTGVELTLAESGQVTGLVIDEHGTPISDATVLLRDAEGRPLHRLEGTTDYEGKFEIDKVPAGDVFVSARSGRQVSKDSPPLRVGGAVEARLELTLRAGVALIVRLEDQDGAPLRAAIRVEDETGHDHVELRGWDEFERLASGGVSSTERRVGPLPPGRYTLSATSTDGRTGSATVDLAPDDEEHVLTLALKP